MTSNPIDNSSDEKALDHLRLAPASYNNSMDLDDDKEFGFWLQMYDRIFHNCREIYYSTLSHIIKASSCGSKKIFGNSTCGSAEYNVIQFWDDGNPPQDVLSIMNLWRDIYGDRYRRFDGKAARQVIEQNYSEDFVAAYDLCWHPAMRSDFFRLCYILKNGGFYIDADEVPINPVPDFRLDDGHTIALQPFIRGWDMGVFQPMYFDNYLKHYDHFYGSEVYYNNAPIIASAGNPVIGLALRRAKHLILSGKARDMSIHDVTGPTNLSTSIVIHFLRNGILGEAPANVIALDWPLYARTADPAELSYKQDQRNWRVAEEQ